MKYEEIYVDILLSTYNGEKYLVEQIESLIAQTYKNWHLLIRDDGSSDGTTKIVRYYTERYPDRIIYINEHDKIAEKLGICLSFFNLLHHSNAEYTMFCDQDDVWLPNKIEVTLNGMLSMECGYTQNMPILMHTDLQVVDNALNIISSSICKYRNIKPNCHSLSRMLVQNVVTGCTVMINLALKKKLKNVPREAIMHDWWIALVAAAFGKIKYMNITPIYYRQHSCNVVGAKKWGIKYFIIKVFNFSKLKDNYLLTQQQSKAFLKEYTNELDREHRNIISTFASLSKYNFFKRKILFFRNKYFMSGIIRNLFIILFC